MNDHRQNSFHIKFNTAGNALGVAPEKIVSLKIRDCVNSYSEYHDMVHALEMEFGVQSSPVSGELQGKGYLLIKQNSKVIIVEHETGLEILYIAGSIASLISLIPIILQAWNALRRFTNPRNPFHAVEVRRLDEKGELHENTVHMDHHAIGSQSSLALTAAANILEGELQKITGQAELLAPKITALEQRLSKVEAALKLSKSQKRKSKVKK
jgi:hypothetical protein